VQWEFAGRLGPPPGRYVVRRYAGDEVREVVVLAEFPGAVAKPKRRSLRGAAARAVSPAPAPAAVPVTRVTVIDAAPLADDATAAEWLRRATGAEAVRVGAEAAATLARFVAAHRVSAADAAVGDPDLAHALSARVGYGSGEQVAEGVWTDANELPLPEPPRLPGGRRRSQHRPAERLSALMSARDAILACEELTLRARGDLDRGRDREAALQLEAALAAALAELAGWRELGDLPDRLIELAGYSAGVAVAAAAAREGRLESAHVESVTAALARLESALRARAIYAAERM
jgi:hypothetical protein